MSGALAGLRVVEIADDLAGSYCTKLLVDLGAEAVKIEPPSGDPLREWGPFPNDRADPERSAMFEYLNAGKRGATADLESPDGVERTRRLIADAHVLVEALSPGTLAGYGLDTDALVDLSPGLVVVRISNFGQDGPLRDRIATPLTMQAASGWVNTRDADRPPGRAGGTISEYVAGGYAALGALTALRIRSAGIVEVDVSVLESLLSTLPYPMLMAERMRNLGLPSNTRAAPMMGIVRAADGWIGINCLTGQHWLDVCAMLGLPEYGEHQIAIMLGGPERAEFFTKAQPWLAERTVAEILELGQAMRIPAAPVNDGATAPQCPQYIDRGFFVEGGGDDWSFLRPGAPYRLSRTPVLPPRRAPRLGAEEAFGGTAAPDFEAASDPSKPFTGVKVFDLSTFWAGAYLTCYLGAFGADVIKVESIQRPDGHRYSGAWSYEGDRWYERSGIWQGTNLNKRDLTLDLTSERGRELARSIAGEVDVVVENFSPRVVDQFGLGYEALRELNPGIIYVRMPGFGLHGPWRDYVGWALNIEQTSGMSAVTGYPDGPPCNIQGPADPIVGVHAGVALLAALEHRRRTGEGQLIEVTQIDVAACLVAEPVIEYSMNGVVPPREGNRSRGCLQGVYPTSDDQWVAISVRVGPDCVVSHDDFDEAITEWTRQHSADEIVDVMHAQRIPAERVLTADRMYDLPQLDARRYYEGLTHPITGLHRYPGWPFTITPGPHRHHRSPPPTLGEHNRDILRGLGLTDGEIEDLRARQVIGERALNA